MNDRNDRGLSDALGAVVLISVVALGVTLFGVAILSGPLPDRIPALNAEVTNTSDTVFIRHTGGIRWLTGNTGSLLMAVTGLQISFPVALYPHDGLSGIRWNTTCSRMRKYPLQSISLQ